MAMYAALLRGISPTNPNMSNERLRKLFEKLGFGNVSTVISSGNVLFYSNKKSKVLEAMIEKSIPKLGFKSTTIIKSKEQLKNLVNKNPFKGIQEAKNSRLNVTFLKNEPKTILKFPHKGDGYTLLGIYENAICSSIDPSATSPDLMLMLESSSARR
jgi:uncharacterized protein (DUF1697 family)